MRKMIITFMLLLTCMNLVLGVNAAESILSIPEVPVSEDQTVYVAVTLTESVIGDSMGITYSYDKEVLEAVYGSATWGKQGMLQDFSREDAGVWASGQAMDLKGTVCVLAFRVKSGVTLTETKVSCTVTVKNDAEHVGTYTAEGRVYAVCDHNYGKYESSGNLSHSRTCQTCGDKQTQSHIWGTGIITDHPDHSHLDLITYTCEVCMATKSEEIPNQGDIPKPPSMTEAPTEPEYVTRPPETAPPATRPTYPRPEDFTVPMPTGGQKPTEEQKATETQGSAGNQNNGGNQNSGDTFTDYNDQGNAGNKNPGTTHNPSDSKKDPTAPVDGTGAAEQLPTEEHTENPYHVTDPMVQTYPIAVPVPETEAPHDHGDHETGAMEPTEPVHDHTHDAEPVQITGDSVMALALAMMLIIVAVGLAVILLKRIKRK